MTPAAHAALVSPEIILIKIITNTIHQVESYKLKNKINKNDIIKWKLKYMYTIKWKIKNMHTIKWKIEKMYTLKNRIFYSNTCFMVFVMILITLSSGEASAILCD